MPAVTQKTYQINIELSNAQQNLADAGKLLVDLKTKAAAANTEARETKEIYQANAAALKELVQQGKQLEKTKAGASAGEPFMRATAALDKNLAAQKRLNSVVQESKIDFQEAKAAAEAAGAAVGQQAAKVKELGAGVKEYDQAAKAAAQDFAPGTFGAITQEVDALKSRLSNLVPGSKEAAVAIQQLADKQSALRQLALATQAANPRSQARAFGVLTQALTGVVGISISAAQVLGLSEQTAQKYAAAMQGVVGVLYSVESINKLLNAENLSLIKSIWASAAAWLGFGKSAEVGAAEADAALTSTGIGVILVAIGVALAVVVGLWSKFSEGAGSSESSFTKFKAAVVGGFDALLAIGKDWLKFWLQLFTLDFSGAIATMRGAGQDAASAYQKGSAEVFAAARREEIKLEVEHRSRLIEILRAKGNETLDLEIQNAARKLESLAQSNREERAAYEEQLKELTVLRIQYRRKQEEEERAQKLAHLGAITSIEEANGRAVIEQQRAVLQEKLIQQIEADELAGKHESAAHIQLLAEIQALDDSYDKEQQEKRQAAQLAGLNARISLQKAKGRESFALEVAEAERELAFLKSAAQVNQAEVIAAQGRIADLKAARRVELTERAHAAELASLDAGIALQNAKGEESYQAQVAREEKQLQFLRQAGIVSLAAVRAQLGKIAAMKAAQQVKEDNEERAADVARQQSRINFLRAQGEDTSQLEINLKTSELNTLLNAATKNQAAILAKEGEIQTAIEAQRIAAEERKRALQIEEFENEMTLAERRGKDVLALRIKFAREQVALDTDTTEKGLARRRADVQKLKELELEMSQRTPDLGAALLQKLFKVKPEDVLAVKQAVTQAVTVIAQSAGELTRSLLDGAMQETEQALAAAQEVLQTADQQLSQVQNKAQATANALASAEGARRDYLLGKLAKERAETERLANIKAKAAREEKAQLEEKHRLEKIGAELTAASTLATNVAAAASAVYAGIKAIEKGAEAGAFPANLVAVATSIAAIVAAIASARQLATATKMADGGIIQGGSHASGNDVPVFGGRVRVEGGEAITPVDATRNNGALLELIRTRGRGRTLTLADMAEIGRIRVKSTPQGYYGNGGVLSKGNTAAATGQVVVSAAELSELVENTRAIVAGLQVVGQHTAATAQATTVTAAYGPPRIVRGHQEVLDDEQLLREAKQAGAAVTL